LLQLFLLHLLEHLTKVHLLDRYPQSFSLADDGGFHSLYLILNNCYVALKILII
jgi:hypothetical protein